MCIMKLSNMRKRVIQINLHERKWLEYYRCSMSMKTVVINNREAVPYFEAR